MATKPQKAKSNVVPLKNPEIFHVEGSVKPPVMRPDDKKNDVEKMESTFSANLNFAGVDMQDLYRMAAQTIVIKLAGNVRSKFQATWNKQTKKYDGNFAAIMKETFPAVINVKEAIVPKLRSTSKANAVEAVGKKIDKMSDEQKAKLLAMLTKK